MADAEPVIPPSEEVAPVVEGAAAEVVETSPEAVRAAALAKLPDVYREAFADEHDEAELDTISAGITAQKLRDLDPATRAVLRASLRREEAAIKARDEERKAADTALAADRATLAEETRKIRQEQAALMELARGTGEPVPDKPPEVDVFTPEGQQALAKWHGERGVQEALTPLRQRAIEVDRATRWNAIVETHPALRDQAVLAEFTEHVKQRNVGVDLAKGDKPRVDTETAAREFFNAREIAELRSREAARVNREASDRAEAARAVARSTHGGGTGNAVDRYKKLLKIDEDAALELLERDPEVRKAVLESNGIHA